VVSENYSNTVTKKNGNQNADARRGGWATRGSGQFQDQSNAAKPGEKVGKKKQKGEKGNHTNSQIENPLENLVVKDDIRERTS